MPTLIRTNWSGTTGGPGLTQIAVDQKISSFGPLTAAEGQSAVNAMRAFWDAIKAFLPDEIVLNVNPTCDTYLVHNGQLAWSMTAAATPAAVSGTSATTYAMAAGLKINENTGVIQNGRRVRGSIFVVPSCGGFSSNGLVAATTKTTINTAGATFLSSLDTAGLKMVVWSRPIPSGKPNGPRDGTQSTVTGLDTNEKTAILRGRRD